LDLYKFSGCWWGEADHSENRGPTATNQLIMVNVLQLDPKILLFIRLQDAGKIPSPEWRKKRP